MMGAEEGGGRKKEFSCYPIATTNPSVEGVRRVIDQIISVGKSDSSDEEEYSLLLKKTHEMILRVSDGDGEDVAIMAYDERQKFEDGAEIRFTKTVDYTKLYPFCLSSPCDLDCCDLFGRGLFRIASFYGEDFTTKRAESGKEAVKVNETVSSARKRKAGEMEGGKGMLWFFDENVSEPNFQNARKQVRRLCDAFLLSPTDYNWTGLSGMGHIYFGDLSVASLDKAGQPQPPGGVFCHESAYKLWAHALSPELLSFMLCWVKWVVLVEAHAIFDNVGGFSIALRPPVAPFPCCSCSSYDDDGGKWRDYGSLVAFDVCRDDGEGETVLSVGLGCIGPRLGEVTVSFSANQ